MHPHSLCPRSPSKLYRFSSFFFTVEEEVAGFKTSEEGPCEWTNQYPAADFKGKANQCFAPDIDGAAHSARYADMEENKGQEFQDSQDRQYRVFIPFITSRFVAAAASPQLGSIAEHSRGVLGGGPVFCSFPPDGVSAASPRQDVDAEHPRSVLGGVPVLFAIFSHSTSPE